MLKRLTEHMTCCDRVLFGGWQVRVVHERGGLRRYVLPPYSQNVGKPAATKITHDLYPTYGDGIYHFVRWSGKRYKTLEPKCEEIFKVKVDNAKLRFLTPEHPRPCSEFFG
jgi:hypothetical protein